MRKHVARIKAIWPSDQNIAQLLDQKAYCGISLSNPNYSGKRLEAVINFLSDQFSSFILVTGGHLYRYHYRLFHQDMEIALLHALEVEQKYVNEHLRPTLNKMFISEKVKVLSWSEIILMREFKISLTEVINFYNKELIFHSDINKIANDFIKKQMSLHKVFTCSIVEAKQLSINFLLEELAVFDLLVKKGYLVDVYPGVNVTAIRDIKKFADAPKGLLKRISIELTIHRTGSSSAKTDKIKELNYDELT
jgi:tRNA-dependent cyclodipeptide synthase